MSDPYTSNRETFGSPKERDDVARIERGITDVVERKAKHFESVVDRLAPRAIGSQRVPPQDEFREYLLTIADQPDPTEAGFQWVQERAQQYGVAKALEMFADYVERNEKRLQQFANVPRRD